MLKISNRSGIFQLLFFSVLLSIHSLSVFSQTGAIRINQLGYYPEANKIGFAVFTGSTTFEVINADDNTVELSGSLSPQVYWKDSGDSIKRFDFSALTKTGTYKIRIPGFGESYPFEISETVLRKAAYASLKSFYYQRSSYALTAPYAGLWTRLAGHPDTACVLHSSTGKSGKIASPGGWYDAGDYGKYVINAGISVGSLLSFYENFRGVFGDGTIHIPESRNGKNDLLDEVKFELDWLKTMQDDDGGVFFKLTTLSFSGMIMPDKDVATRYVIGKTTASALDFAAMMAMAGRIYSDKDADYAADCVIRAGKAWAWAKANPAIYFKNPSDVSTGEYGDSSVNDEFIWAAAELYITTKQDEYKTYLEGKSTSLRYQSAPGWASVQPLAALSLATQANGLPEAILTNVKNSIISTADSWLTQITSNAARIPNFGFHWGSNSGIANQGVGLLYAYILTGNVKYIKGAAECADYLLGKNATGYSFVSGYGSKTPMNFHHRPSHADGIIQPVPGFVSGGPNSGKEDNQQYPFSQPAKCFVDVMGSYASNEVCINWNSPMTALFAGIDAILGDSSVVDFPVQTSMNNPPQLNISFPGYDQKVGSDIPLKVKGTAADPDGISKIEFYVNARYRGEVYASPFEFSLDGLPFGSHVLTVLAFDSKGLVSGKSNIFQYYIVSALPCKIEAEHFSNMTGISTQVTTDTGAGLCVTGITASDWMDYVITVPEAGQYVVEFRVAAPSSGGKFELRKATAFVLSSISVPATGGSQVWTTLSDTITLSAGRQTVRVHAVTGGWNFNWINLEHLSTTSIQNPFIPGSGYSLSVFPNPAVERISVKYHMTEPAGVTFTLYDGRGSLIGIRKSEDIQTHSGEFIWNFDSKLVPGNYYLGMQHHGKNVAIVKFLKIE